ncbi:hypothetical protein IT575_12735 [bacterium]|nr:hypothetical protein [bacterium]
MRLLILFAALMLLALLAACGGGGKAAPAGSSGQNAGQSDSSGRGVSLALSTATEGDGMLRLSISASGATSLHQMSLRLAYDPRAVRPVDVERGALIDERAVFFSAPDKPAAREAAYVPVAFTYHPGEVIPGSSGELLSMRFEVLDSGRDPGLQLIRDEKFLLARDRSGEDLQVLTGAGDE